MKLNFSNSVPMFCLACSVALEVYLFAASRNDPSLRIAALVSGTTLVGTLAAIASTMLTGKDLTQKAQDLPPNSTATTSVTTGPTRPAGTSPLTPAPPKVP